MGSFSWTHLILAVLIIVFAVLGYTWLVVILAAVIAILSIFGVCCCGSHSKKASYAKHEVKPIAPKKRRK